MKILNGKKLAVKWQKKLKKDLEKVKERAGLAVILIGNDPASSLYVKLKEKACKDIGMYFKRYKYPTHVTRDEIIDCIKKLNVNPQISGIIVQLPLPDHLDPDKIISHIHPRKDVDGFHHDNLMGLQNARASQISPVALSVWELLKETKQNLKGKNAVILVNSEIFAIPISHLLRQKGMDTTILISSSKTQLSFLPDADVIIIAIGHANFLKGNMIKENTIIIDIGINRIDKNTIVGDVDFKDVKKKTSYITPVPGGIGPMTVTMLLSNTISSAKKSRYNEE